MAWFLFLFYEKSGGPEGAPKKKIVFQLKPKLSHSIMCSRYTAE